MSSDPGIEIGERGAAPLRVVFRIADTQVSPHPARADHPPSSSANRMVTAPIAINPPDLGNSATIKRCTGSARPHQPVSRAHAAGRASLDDPNHRRTAAALEPWVPDTIAPSWRSPPPRLCRRATHTASRGAGAAATGLLISFLKVRFRSCPVQFGSGSFPRQVTFSSADREQNVEPHLNPNPEPDVEPGTGTYNVS